ncbi:MAG: ATP-dependent DNA helicase RecG [Clostridia bacterium]|nr:ATP-dependent DNA helicase RecG [Clostridia bacterium]
MAGLDMPVGKLKGIGKVKEEAFHRLGIFTLSDLLNHFPTRYENRGVITLLADGTVGAAQSYLLTVATAPKMARLRGSMTIVKFRAFDDSGSVEISYFNQPYVKDKFSVGETYRFYGKLTEKLGRFSLSNPVAEVYDERTALPELYAVYRISSPLNKNVIRDCVRQALSICRSELFDFVPHNIREKYALAGRTFALESIHIPESLEALDRAARRLAFDELLETSIAVRVMRKKQAKSVAERMKVTDLSPFMRTVPFSLTGAQSRAINDIIKDMCAGDGDDAPRMSRILVGDVGCGKTVCAAAAMYMTMASGFQTLIMAPTEILASQHYKDLAPQFESLGFYVEKLTGSTTAAEKRRIKSGLADGSINAVVGTHALIEDDVIFKHLGLAVCDEQHRFGISQRANLLRKSPRSHMLVMTATPIPRTLSLVLYGDLQISKIDELPPGRQKVGTYFVDESYRPRLNAFIEKQISEGGQVYVVCPSVEPPEDDADEDAYTVSAFETESSPPLKSAVAFSKELSEIFPKANVTYIHGKLKNADKNDIMSRFVSGEIKILVSTTVIEVGINVPNASLMIIENAERFGLSQLHQLRGRVGRGTRHSHCVLVSDTDGAVAKQRLKLMTKTNDGFVIAEEDLKMRGPGDFLGTDGARQSGVGENFRMAAICNDPTVAEAAVEAATDLIENDPALTSPALAPLRERIQKAMETSATTMN